MRFVALKSPGWERVCVEAATQVGAAGDREVDVKATLRLQAKGVVESLSQRLLLQLLNLPNRIVEAASSMATAKKTKKISVAAQL